MIFVHIINVNKIYNDTFIRNIIDPDVDNTDLKSCKKIMFMCSNMKKCISISI
jgi:hypothetical protein